MFNIKKVEVYDVNGYMVCTDNKKELENYLSDVPEEKIMNKDYVDTFYVVLTEKEDNNFKCKELYHLKFNQLYETRELAELSVEIIKGKMTGCFI